MNLNPLSPHARIRSTPTLLAAATAILFLAGCGSDSRITTQSSEDHSARKGGQQVDCKPAAQEELETATLSQVSEGKPISISLPQQHVEATAAVTSSKIVPTIKGESTLHSKPGSFVIVAIRFKNTGDKQALPAEIFLDRLALLDKRDDAWGVPSHCEGVLSAVASETNAQLPNVAVRPGKTVKTFWVLATPNTSDLRLAARYTGKFVSLRAG
jgi:hypothetical protein